MNGARVVGLEIPPQTMEPFAMGQPETRGPSSVGEAARQPDGGTFAGAGGRGSSVWGRLEPLRLSLSQRWSGGFEELAGVAEEVDGLARLGDDGHLLRHAVGVRAHAVQAGVEAGEHEDGAAGQLAGKVGQKVDAVAAGHVDVAEHEIGRGLPERGERLLGVVGDGGIETVSSKDDAEGLGYERFIVDDKDAHGGGNLIDSVDCIFTYAKLSV